jgi:hypothetical protein
MASQAESLQQLMGFFHLGDNRDARLELQVANRGAAA